LKIREDYKSKDLKGVPNIQSLVAKEQVKVSFPHTSVTMNHYMYLNWEA